jgi:O-antigen ligase
VAFVIVGLMVATVVFTKSRGGALGLVVTLIALMLLGHKVRRGFGTLLLAAVVVAVPFLPQSFLDRMTTIADEQQDRLMYTGSREARRVVMQEGIDTFMEFPLTGVGAGQFKNYNPPGRQERWHETHNVLIQVAAETGLFGLLAFGFLIVRSVVAATSTRRMLARTRGRASPDPLDALLDPRDRSVLHDHAVATTAGLAGWFACAMFASVAYSWTFYYLLALIVAARELSRNRLSAAAAVRARVVVPPSVAPAGYSRRPAPGLA